MKATLNTALRPAGSVPPPSVLPSVVSTRPVRRGSFWPGESFAEYQPKSGLPDALADYGFILPGIIGRGSRSH
jgi:hypothetical protein